MSQPINSQSLEEILKLILDAKDEPTVLLLKGFVNSLRVDLKKTDSLKQKSEYGDLVNQKIDELIKLLTKHPKYANGLGCFLLSLINRYDPNSVYANIGMGGGASFIQKLTQLISHRMLPMIIDENDIMSLVDEVFDNDDDIKWLLSIDTQKFDVLIDSIHLDEDDLHLVATAKNNILNAMVILSQRISGMGLNTELMSKYPQMHDYSSSFVAQAQETLHYVDGYRKLHKLDNLTDHTPSDDISPKHLQVMLEQCSDIVQTVRKQVYKTGITVTLSSLLLILEKRINRMELLVDLVADYQSDRDKSVFALLKSHVKHSKKRFSILALINDNTRLLSKKVTENASKVGEHYITTDRAGYFMMFKKAAIGGLIIPIMATIKILSYEVDLAPLWRAVIDSLIYGLGFVFIHVIHGTVATKQPAMTAAAIATTISHQQGNKSKHQLNTLSELIVDITRSQSVAIAGNIMLAMPIALILSVLWFSVFGTNFVDNYKAGTLLADLNPITSLAIPHAMLAGVFLFLSGLIGGYYDNLATTNKIKARILKHKPLNKLLPAHKVKQFALYIENNLGAIMSNFLFGMLLGSAGTIGYILGLPLDIRHIAFASANFAHGLYNIDAAAITLWLVAISAIGVLLIGLANLVVSFSLALFVALRSKHVNFYEWGELMRMVFVHLITHPLDFLYPRETPIKYQHIDNEGHILHDDANSIAMQKNADEHHIIRDLPRKSVDNNSDNE